MKQKIKWTIVSANLGKKIVEVEIEISGIPAIEKITAKKMVSYDQFSEMLCESAGVKFEARKVIRAKPVSQKTKRKNKKRESKANEIGKGRAEAEAEVEHKKKEPKEIIEKEEEVLEKKGYIKIGTIPSPRGARKKMKTNIYYREERFYARSLTSKRRKMYSLKKADYEKIMEQVNVITEPQDYISLQDMLKVSLGISPNRFYVWTCVARALGHIEENYNKKKDSSMIKPTGRFGELEEQLKGFGSS